MPIAGVRAGRSLTAARGYMAMMANCRTTARSLSSTGVGTARRKFGRRFKSAGIEQSPPSRRRGSDGPMYANRSEEHTPELQSLMRISYAVFCLKKKNQNTEQQRNVQ